MEEKYLGLIEDYISNWLYLDGEVNFLRTYKNIEYYEFTQWLNEGTKKHFIHTDGKNILDSKGNPFKVERE